MIHRVARPNEISVPRADVCNPGKIERTHLRRLRRRLFLYEAIIFRRPYGIVVLMARFHIMKEIIFNIQMNKETNG